MIRASWHYTPAKDRVPAFWQLMWGTVILATVVRAGRKGPYEAFVPVVTPVGTFARLGHAQRQCSEVLGKLGQEITV